MVGYGGMRGGVLWWLCGGEEGGCPTLPQALSSGLWAPGFISGRTLSSRSRSLRFTEERSRKCECTPPHPPHPHH
jgi:hypothetical protein